jgi:hypothetical protein
MIRGYPFKYKIIVESDSQEVKLFNKGMMANLNEWLCTIEKAEHFKIKH